MPYFDLGAPVVLPSGQTGQFMKWRARPVVRGDASQGLERVAIVRLDGSNEPTEFSERFMELVKPCTR